MAGALTLVYARLDDRYFAWSIAANPSDPIRMKILSQTAKSIEDKGIALRRLCADPKSSMQDIKTLSASLYSDLVAPFADQVDHADTIQLELDPALASVPFAAISADKTPLGLQHPLVFLREGWTFDHTTPDVGLVAADQDRLTDQTHMLVLREASQPGAAIIPGEYDESAEITRLFAHAQLESATLQGVPARRFLDIMQGLPTRVPTSAAPKSSTTQATVWTKPSRDRTPRCSLLRLASGLCSAATWQFWRPAERLTKGKISLRTFLPLHVFCSRPEPVMCSQPNGM